MFHIKSFLLVLFLANVYADLQNFPHDQEKESKNEYWLKLGRDEIQRNLKFKESKRVKNAILFLGDGMGISTITSARILKGQREGRSGEEGYLFFERFPFTALIKTYNVDHLVPDSAGTATCYLSGVKSNYEVIGVNAKINSKEKDCAKIQANKVVSIMEMARKEGKSIGVVTTTRITHATPAGSYAHAAHRDHESDLPEETKLGGCKDIARQLIEDEPGMSFSVILGGGRKMFLPKSIEGGVRNDNLNLIYKWKEMKSKKFNESQYKFVETVDQLNNINVDEVESLFGLFNLNHITYNTSLPEKDRTDPTLREMSNMAIKILSKNPKGFVLLVEGGRIDLASHANNAYQALHETVHFDETIDSAAKLVNQEETLILVTADHSHTLNINGYPKRGTNIFGFSDKTEMDNDNKETGKKFTILTYGTGPGKKNPGEREDPQTDKNLGTNKYINYAGIRRDDSNHGGEDVALFSNNWGNLVRGVKEQNYVAHVIAYTSCIGNYTNEPHCSENNAQPLVAVAESSSNTKIWVGASLVVIAIVFIVVYFLKRNNKI